MSYRMDVSLHPASCAGCVMHGCPAPDRVDQWRAAEEAARAVIANADAWERADGADETDEGFHRFVEACRLLRLSVGSWRAAVAALDAASPVCVRGDVCPTCGLPR